MINSIQMIYTKLESANENLVSWHEELESGEWIWSCLRVDVDKLRAHTFKRLNDYIYTD